MGSRHFSKAIAEPRDLKASPTVRESSRLTASPNTTSIERPISAPLYPQTDRAIPSTVILATRPGRDIPGVSHHPARTRRDALIDEALDIFQPRTSEPLSREDGREIFVNLTGFFRVLRSWERAEREQLAREAASAADGEVVAPVPPQHRSAS